MTVREAREWARQWVREHAAALPEFCGAYTAGSTNWLADGAEVPAASDLDVMVVVAGGDRAGTRCRFFHGGALLEASYLRDTQYESPALLLSDYRLAPSFHTAQILSDPLGLLTPLQAAVSQEFAKKEWVSRRCGHAAEKVLANLRSIDEAAPLHDQAIACLFAAGVTTHILLSAGLRNPTVRKRYQAVRDLLTFYGRGDFHETLLAILGSAHMSREEVSHYAAALPEMPGEIAAGYHREAMFWIAVTHSRRREWSADYRELLSGMGLSTSAAIRRRAMEIERALAEVCSVAEAIVAGLP